MLCSFAVSTMACAGPPFSRMVVTGRSSGTVSTAPRASSGFVRGLELGDGEGTGGGAPRESRAGGAATWRTVSRALCSRARSIALASASFASFEPSTATRMLRYMS